MKRTHARTTNSTGHAIDVCLNEMRGWTEGKKNEKHDFDSDSNNQKTMEHGTNCKTTSCNKDKNSRL